MEKINGIQTKMKQELTQSKDDIGTTSHNNNIAMMKKETIIIKQDILNNVEQLIDKNNAILIQKNNEDIMNHLKKMKLNFISKKESNDNLKQYNEQTTTEISKVTKTLQRSIDDLQLKWDKKLLKHANEMKKLNIQIKSISKKTSNFLDNNNNNKNKHKVVVGSSSGDNNVGGSSIFSNLLFSSASSNTDRLTLDGVKGMIHHAIETSFADRTGLVDYAIEVAGGQIVRPLTSKTYYHSYSARISGHVVPEQIIRPNMKLGHCWPIDGSNGYVGVKLHPYGQVIPTSITLEHVSKQIAHDIRSAPNEFEIWSYNDPNDPTPRKLFAGTYDVDNVETTSVQNFQFENDSVSPIVQLRVLSNHGHPIHTCIYRFRVHGELMDGSSDDDVLMD